MSASKDSLSPPQDASTQDIQLLQKYLSEMPIHIVLGGLEFARNRWRLQDSGTLNVGRKGVVNGEVEMVTAEQARWRLSHWKIMIANYRQQGYSYPTISRIKKRLIQLASD